MAKWKHRAKDDERKDSPNCNWNDFGPLYLLLFFYIICKLDTKLKVLSLLNENVYTFVCNTNIFEFKINAFTSKVESLG